MDVSSLKAQIQTKQIPSHLIFSGSEWAVQKIYIQQIAKIKNQQLVYVDSIADIYSKLKNRSFVSTAVCYVVRDDKELLSNEKLQSQIDNGLLADNTLIHLLTSVDKRTKYYKQYKDTIIEFEPLNDAILKKYIKKIIPAFTDKNCDKLIDICEHDYGRILLEIDKIKRYALWMYPEVGHEDESGDYNRTLDDLLKDGTIYKPPYDAIFDLVDAILDRKVNKSFDLLRQSYAVGEATLVMLSVLYNNAKAVLQVQTCNSSDKSKSTGLTTWQIKCASKYVERYSTAELKHMLKLIAKCEFGIKSGRIEDAVVMEYLLIHIL